MSLNILQYVKLVFATKGEIRESSSEIVDWVTSKLSGKADTSHTHTISNVNNLQDTLDTKSSNGHKHLYEDITDLSDYHDSTKVDKVDGKVLSDNNFTTGCKNVVTSVSSALPSGIGESNPLMDKTSVETKIADAVGGITSFEYEIPDPFPPASPQKGVMYLKKISSAGEDDKYEMYLKIGDSLKLISNTTMDLSTYATTSYVNGELDKKQNIKDLTKSTAGGGAGIDENSDDEHYVTPKAVYEFVMSLDGRDHEY